MYTRRNDMTSPALDPLSHLRAVVSDSSVPFDIARSDKLSRKYISQILLTSSL